jgi:3-oxoacyl-[acyl-carrier-protein] synthase II
MNILGIGTVCAAGVGIDTFERALLRGWQKPVDVETARFPGIKYPAYLTDLDQAPDKSLLKKIRRADKLSKMSVLAASEAVKDSGVDPAQMKNAGLILATGFGAQVTTFGFLDDILDYGDAAVSPTTFSNSVHNAAASYVASSLMIKGPTLTVTQFRFSFQAALQLANAWLLQKRCDYVLLGAVDQYGDVLGYVSNAKLPPAKDGRIKPFTFKPTCHVPGEGAEFYLLSLAPENQAYCSIRSVSIYGTVADGTPADVDIIDADGLLVDESCYLSSLSQNVPVTAYSPVFGTMMTGSAFNVASGALMLKKQMHYAAPVQDNPQGLSLLSETREAAVTAIRCTGFDCYGEKAAVLLARQMGS